MMRFYALICIILNWCGESACETCVHLLDRIPDTSKISPDKFCRYNSATSEFERLELMKPNRRSLCSVDQSNDIEGAILTVGIDELYPYVMWDKNKTAVTGYFGDVWTILQDALKFRTNLKPSRKYKDVSTGRFDVILTSSLVKISPTVFFSYSSVIGTNSYSLFALSEGTYISKWWYVDTFHKYVWLLSTLFVVILTISMMVIYNIKKKLCKRTDSQEFGYSTFNLLCVLGATSGQGFQELPRSWSLRLCALTTLNMGMLLSCGFNSTLTSYLAFRAPYLGMNSLEDVLKRGTHSLCVRNQSLAYDKLTGRSIADNGNVDKEKWAKLLNRKCPNMYDSVELRKNLCKPGFVYMETSDLFFKQYRYVEDKCQIVKMPGTYWNSEIAFLLYRGSKHRKIINRYLLRLRSAGILNYLETKWAFHQDFQHGVFNSYQEVELGHVQILIMGFVIFTFVSIFICIIENIWFRYQESLRKNNQFPLGGDPFKTKPSIDNLNILDHSLKRFN